MLRGKKTTFLFSILLALIILFTYSNKVFAAINIQLISFPSSVVAGSEFDVGFSADSLEVGTKYYLKAFSSNCYDVETWNSAASTWLKCNDGWDEMPDLTASESSVSASFRARFKDDLSTGTYSLELRLRKASGGDIVSSSPVNISVSKAPTPTATATATSTATSAPTETSTSIPTSTATVKATPTKTPTPKASVKASSSSTPSASDESGKVDVLGLRQELVTLEPSASPEEVGAKKKVSPLSVVFLMSGGLVIGLAGFSSLKTWGKEYNERHEEKKPE